jgi:hypothetical protein
LRRETLIKTDLKPDNNRYENDSISNNNQANFVAINKVTNEEFKEGENSQIGENSKKGNFEEGNSYQD